MRNNENKHSGGYHQWERIAKAEWYFQTSLATKTFENSVIHIKSTSSTLI